MSRHAEIAVLFLLAGLSLSAQQPTPTPPSSESGTPAQSPTFRLGVDYLEVDAVVADRQGNVVRGLTKEDFQIFEDGKPQTIAAFSVVDIPAESAEQPRRGGAVIRPDVASNAKPFSGRLYVMVIDDLHIGPGLAPRTRDAARRFVEQHLGAADLMAVIHTIGSQDASQAFTSDRQALLAAIDRTTGRSLGSASLAVAHDERAYSVDQRQAHDALSAYQTLQKVADWLGRVRNRRKAILFVSEGVDYDITNVVPDAAKVAVANMAPGANVSTQEYAGAVVQAVGAAVDAARRNNVAIYGIDPRGLAYNRAELDIEELGAHRSLVSEVRLAQDSLRAISEQTGGFAVVDRNSFDAGYRRIVAENSSYYVLAYHSPANDGKFHEITVRVDRPGVTVNARKGYLAPKNREPAAPADASDSLSTEIRDALSSPIPVSGLAIRAFAAPFKGPSSIPSVLLGTELSGDGLALTAGDKVEVAYLAVDAVGKTHDSQTYSVTLNLEPASRDRMERNGLRLLNRLSLPPGHYQVRVAVRDEGSGRVGSVVNAVDVPDFSQSPVALSGIVLTSTTASLMPTPQPDSVLQPVVPAPPAALRAFPQTDTVAVYAEGYDHGATSQTVGMSATVTDSSGKIVIRSTGAPLTPPRTGAASATLAVRLPMKDLSPGPYVLTVTAQSQAPGVPPAVRQVPFSVVTATVTSTSSELPEAPVAGPCCSDQASYEANVRAFARGDRAAASLAIVRAPADQLEHAVDGLRRDDEKLLEAAAVMHLILGSRATETSLRQQMSLHLKSSYSAFQKIRRAENGPFAAAWYAAATRLSLSIGDFNGAAAIVERGRDEHIPQGGVVLAEGIVNETQALRDRWMSAGDRTSRAQTRGSLGVRAWPGAPWRPPPVSGGSTVVGRLTVNLDNAERAYRKSLAIDPTSEEARLRLGRVLALKGKDAEARTTLEHLIAASHDQRFLYLAHLFLADLATRRNDAEAAVSEYEAAIAANSSSRVAYVGLSNLAMVAGNQRGAREHIRDWSSRNAAPADDVWIQYQHGIDQLLPALNALLGMISR